LDEKDELEIAIIGKGENTGRCRGKQVIYEVVEQNSRDNRVIKYS